MDGSPTQDRRGTISNFGKFVSSQSTHQYHITSTGPYSMDTPVKDTLILNTPFIEIGCTKRWQKQGLSEEQT